MSKEPSNPSPASFEEEVCQALQTSETALAAYYAISPREWSTRFRYDVAQAAEHPALAFPRGSLAQIVRLERAGAQGLGRYRIVIRDREILALGQRFPLSVVLAYTLAHELVHLVRFASGLAPFELPEAEREPEERRVRRITRDALRTAFEGEAALALEALAQQDS